MSIKNEAKIKNPLIVAIREQLEHRALWMYLLCDEAKKKGLPADDYAPDAIKRWPVSRSQSSQKGRRQSIPQGTEKDVVHQASPMGI